MVAIWSVLFLVTADSMLLVTCSLNAPQLMVVLEVKVEVFTTLFLNARLVTKATCAALAPMVMVDHPTKESA